MPRNSGTYSAPSGQPVVNGDIIDATVHNNLITDIGNEITNSMPRDGTAPPTANLPLGGYKITGLADGTSSSDAAAFGQIAAGITGKANLSGATFTGAINEARGTVTMHATTMDLWAQPNTIDGTGSAVTITAIANAPQAGARRTLYPITGTVITHGGNISVQGNASYTVASGDELTITAITTTTFYVTIRRKDGQPVTPATGRRIAQLVSNAVGTSATGTTLIPADNTIPQITEGDQYMTLAITPTNALSTLEIEVTFIFAHSAASSTMTCALFQDAIANALAAAFVTIPFPDYTNTLSFKYTMSAGTTSAKTFRVRAGADTAGTTTFNGFVGVQKLGGVLSSRITIKEYLP